MIVIVSEDGMIDLLPKLRRRVSREDVTKAVDDLVAASSVSVDFEKAATLARKARSLAFYFSEAQVAAANAAFEAIEDAREQAVIASGAPGITRFGYAELKRNPSMNDSYFID